VIEHNSVLCELALVGSELRLHGLSFARLFAALNHNVFYWIRKVAGLAFGATVVTFPITLIDRV
jgi:hypothetical protein